MNFFYAFSVCLVVALVCFKTIRSSDASESEVVTAKKSRSAILSDKKTLTAVAFDSTGIKEKDMDSFQVPEMDVELSTLEALDAFQNAMAENRNGIEDADIMETTLSNIRGYTVTEESL